jgi:hypothetical protein
LGRQKTRPKIFPLLSEKQHTRAHIEEEDGGRNKNKQKKTTKKKLKRNKKKNQQFAPPLPSFSNATKWPTKKKRSFCRFREAQ